MACHNPSYVTKGFPMVRDVKPGGVFLINCQWTPEELEHHLSAAAKRYIAQNNIQLYTINAIDLASQIGMGKRTNTILQSAFFSLAKVMPEDEAIQYMKDAATHSYLKKGQDVVDMNHKAIDAGATAFRRSTCPPPGPTPRTSQRSKPPAPPSWWRWSRPSWSPWTAWTATACPSPPSCPMRTAPSSRAPPPMRSGAWPSWCPPGIRQVHPVQPVRLCLPPRHHPSLRPDRGGGRRRPRRAKIVDVKAGKGKGVYKFTLAVSPLDCMGCSVCASICPTKALTMVPQEQEAAQQAVFDYMVANVSVKEDMADLTVKGSQFKKPLLEFSGSCAGCAETAYARLITQLFGDRMYISNATGCSSIWGGPAATSPYTTNGEGKGPAWANSLFEDNAEHGLGLYLGQNAIRQRLAAKTRELIAVDCTVPP